MVGLTIELRGVQCDVFILNIFIALRYTYTTPVVTGSKHQGLGEDDRTPPVGYGHLGIRMPAILMKI